MDVFPLPNQEALTVARKSRSFADSPYQNSCTPFKVGSSKWKLFLRSASYSKLRKTRTTTYHHQSDGLVATRHYSICWLPPVKNTVMSRKTTSAKFSSHITPVYKPLRDAVTSSSCSREKHASQLISSSRLTPQQGIDCTGVCVNTPQDTNCSL